MAAFLSLENSGEENQLLTADEPRKGHLKGDGVVENVPRNTSLHLRCKESNSG